MADIQEWFVEHEVRSFYSVSISGYHIAEAGANPLSPARLHPRQRVHLRGELPGPGPRHRRLRAQPVVLLLERDGPGVHRARPGGPAHLGRRHARPLRRRRAQPEAEVPRADVGPVPARPGDGLQRHPHHPAGPDRALRQRQQPPHQRLRRGRHHPHRGVGAPGAGHPAHHHQGVGPLDEREPQPGQLRDRAAHRPRRGGRAGRARAHLRAGRRARRDGDRATSGAASRTSRCATSSASTTARCRSWGSTRSSPPTRTSTPLPARASWPAAPRRRSAARSIGSGRSRAATPTSVQPCSPACSAAALAGENLFDVLMDAVRVCSLGEITDALFEVGGRYRRNV